MNPIEPEDNINELLSSTELVQLPNIIQELFHKMNSKIDSLNNKIILLQHNCEDAATKEHLEAISATKVDINDFLNTVNNIDQHIKQKPSMEEIKYLSEEKISKSDLQDILEDYVNKKDLENLIENNPKSNNDFINIKKLCINSKNVISKITNQSNSIDIKDKYALLRKKQNRINKLNNILKINNQIKNVYNINNNEIQNINNNSNINIYLSINMFNKMLNNHLNKNKNNNERNNIHDLLNKQKQLIYDNKKKSLDNYPNHGQKKNYFIKNANKMNNNKIFRSNSVGLFLNNQNNIYFRKNNKNSINKLVLNNYK